MFTAGHNRLVPNTFSIYQDIAAFMYELFSWLCTHYCSLNDFTILVLIYPHPERRDIVAFMYALYSWLCTHVFHYGDVIMTTIASQTTSLTIVYSIVYSDADQRKHQSSASLAFVWGIHRDRWIPRTKGQLRGECFHLMTSSCLNNFSCLLTVSTDLFVCFQFITILLLLSLFCCVMYDLYSCLHMHMFFKYFITLVYSYFSSINAQNVFSVSFV